MIKITKSHKCHGGFVHFITHQSFETNCDMNFAVFVPPEPKDGFLQPIPYLLFLSGVSCTEENFVVKAHAFERAALLGMGIVVPDTSPRGANIPNDESDYLGQGAGLYIDASELPWSKHFRMESYVIRELLPLVEKEFSFDQGRKSICGHSMGGHGALTLYLKHQGVFRSCSALAPMVHPISVPWAQRAFEAYIGGNPKVWAQHDACELIVKFENRANENPILIDQGADDPVLDQSLKPHLFQEACAKVGQALDLRLHDGYDHSYFFVQSFIQNHLNWHARYLGIKTF